MVIVRYIVTDIGQVLPFYAALGFEITDRLGPAFVALRRGELSLWLSGPGSSASRALDDGSRPQPGGWARIVIVEADLPAALERVRATGARARSEPVRGPGGLHVVVEDASGNPVELYDGASAPPR